MTLTHHDTLHYPLPAQVEFDEKSCIKLLQILLDVLSSIESNAQLHAQQREGGHGNKDEFQNSVVVEQYGIGIGIGKWNVRSYYNNFKAVEVELLPLLDLFGYHPHHDNSTSTRSLSQSRHHLDHVNDQENQVEVPVNDAGSTVSMTMFMPDPDSTPDSFHKLINLPPEELEIFIDKIAMGDKDTIYPILEYCLSNQDELKERLYLAPFLTPVQVPLDITMTQRGDDLSNLSRGYQNLQDEFKVLYDEYRRLKEEMMNDDEHSNQKGDQGLRTLQEEKVQLMERIGRMEDMASNNHDLYRLFELTRELRKCQEDDVRLRQYKCPEQKNALEAARGKLKHLQSRYDAIRALISNDDEEGTGGRSGSQPLSSSQSSSSSSPAADNILNEIRKEVSSMTMSVRSDLLSQKADIETKIAKLEEANSMPLRTKDELEGLIKTRTELEEEYDTKGSLLSEEQKKASNSKIVIFKKHAKVSASKLKVKRMDVKKKQEQLDEMKKRVKQAEMNLESYVQSTKQREEIHAETCRNIEIDLPDGTRIIGGVDGKSFLDSCHEKCKQRDEVQKKISKLQSETQVLEGTLNALYRRHGNIEEFLKKQEENAGVKGFRETHEQILDTEKRAEEVNRIKGETLQEVSDMVTEMTSRLKRDRKKLQPMVRSYSTEYVSSDLQQYQFLTIVYSSFDRSTT